MPDHQRDWGAMLRQAQRRHDVYAGVIVRLDTSLRDVKAALSPQGEATDQLVNMGIDMINGAPGSNVTRDVLGLCREGSNSHNTAIRHIVQAQNAISRALTQNMLVLARINDALGGIDGV